MGQETENNQLNTAVAIATLTTQLPFIQTQLTDIKGELKTINNIFASKEELITTARQTEERIRRLEEQSNLWRWLSPSLAAGLGAIFSYLVQYFITGTFK